MLEMFSGAFLMAVGVIIGYCMGYPGKDKDEDGDG